ncbi:hypothetical protein BC831DRAFT_445238 [Entophlyctis helioformis]|nr:hypothetical protein BC831DRAFT_445238 [Entophlyctis helioformis]
MRLAVTCRAAYSGWLGDSERRMWGGLARSTTRQRERDARRAALSAVLASHGMRLRSDSELCRKHIDSGVPSQLEVVNMMREMEWFIKQTDYTRIRESMYRRNKYARNHDVSDMAKQENGEHIPSYISSKY